MWYSLLRIFVLSCRPTTSTHLHRLCNTECTAQRAPRPTASLKPSAAASRALAYTRLGLESIRPAMQQPSHLARLSPWGCTCGALVCPSCPCRSAWALSSPAFPCPPGPSIPALHASGDQGWQPSTKVNSLRWEGKGRHEHHCTYTYCICPLSLPTYSSSFPLDLAPVPLAHTPH